ncbi:MAG: LacI family DNA-binding transcriptional regulator [Bacteroidota bacterium]
MIRGRVKITDIAHELGVSTSTVSRALSNEGRISEKTRTSVVELAKKWGYKPNPFAINLLKKQSKNIGLVLPEFTHHYFSKVLSGINKVMDEKGYHLFVNVHEGRLEQEVKAVNILNDMRVDGIIASHARATSDFSHYLDLIEDDVPVVFLDRICEDLDTSYVVTDDFPGCLKAIDHLVETGHRKIAHVAGPEGLSTGFVRLTGYKEGLKVHGLEFEERRVLASESAEWKEKLSALMHAEEVDAVFCFNDYLAFETVEVIKSCGKRIPDEVAVVGFADEPVATFMTPKLTTIMQPAEQMGRRAAEMLIWHIENPDEMDFLCESLPTELVMRESTRKWVH